MFLRNLKFNINLIQFTISTKFTKLTECFEGCKHYHILYVYKITSATGVQTNCS